jgi:hypothetical protein
MTKDMPNMNLNTPQPPKGGVPFGPASKAGTAGTLVLLVAALLDAIVGDSIDADTRLLIAGGVATLITTVFGRMLQAALARVGESRSLDSHSGESKVL